MQERDTRTPLPVTVRTEDGAERTGLGATALDNLVRRLGPAGDTFVVVDRGDGDDDHYIQTARNGAGPYTVEYRDGGPDRHFTTEEHDPRRVAVTIADWALGGTAWRTRHAWEPLDLDLPGLAGSVGDSARELAEELVHGGFLTRDEVVEAVVEHVEDADEEAGDAPGRTEAQVEAQVEALVGRVWRRRAAEQAGWPGTTDTDRLFAALDALDADGVTARADFTCCRTCADAEIGAEAAEGARGYVYFHQQDTARAVAGGGLLLAYGTLPGSAEDTAAVGRAVRAALAGAGLPVEWDGSPESRIRVAPLVWQRRLPGQG